MSKYKPSIFLFSTPFWHFRTEPYKDAITWALEYEKNHPTNTQVSNVGGYQSTSSDDYTEIPFFLESAIKNSLDELPPFVYGNWWLNVNRKGDFNITHTHPDAHSAVVYSITDNQGSLILLNPLNHSREFLASQFGWNSETYKVNALAGDITVFPADVPHRVDPNYSDNPRISLAFNIRYI
tara:strand:+ start:45 stop:587 length:543 start_codon:yes stop_codon:yes gene_type:complete